jgi:hypothetical protein
MNPTRLAVVLAALAALPVLAASKESGSEVNRKLSEIRRATREYQDVEAAQEDGYVLDEHCVPGMGFHALREPLDDPDDAVDHRNPEVLVYAPTDGGTLELVAVEYLSPEETSLFDRPFDEPHGPVPSWTLHAWVWRGNPEGVFNPANPKVSCPESEGGGEH